jgi:hypothetical protein
MYVFMYVYIYMCVLMYVCNVCMPVSMYIYTVYVFMYVCMYVCMYACMYVCMYVRWSKLYYCCMDFNQIEYCENLPEFVEQIEFWLTSETAIMDNLHKRYTRSCTNLDRNSLNIYLSEKCFQQTLYGKWNIHFIPLPHPPNPLVILYGLRDS